MTLPANDRHPAPPLHGGAGTAVIHVHALSYTYPGARARTLHDLSFDVQAGEIFGFLGPSGAGKSTTQRILTGLLTGHEGAVTVFGASLSSLGRGYYERIGVSFEVPNLYGKLTGLENLEFFAGLYQGPTADPVSLLELVGLGDAATERAANYSKGMRMRLNFARSLMRTPELLFLDEPTAGQDPENARRIKNIIRKRRDAGATVFLTTHDMNVAAELCDRVAFLVDGRIVTLAPPGALMVQYGERRVRVRTDAGEDVFDLDGLADNSLFQEQLRSGRITSMHTLDATLEDVFLVITGRALQ